MYFLTCGLYSHSAWKQYESQVVVPWTLVPISWQLVTCNPAQTVQLVAGRFKRSRVAVPSKRVLSVKLLEHLSIRLRSEMLPSDLPSHLDSSVISHLASRISLLPLLTRLARLVSGSSKVCRRS
jgi:hypothetical protein